MYKNYEILKLLVSSYLSVVNLQIVRTKTFIRKRRRSIIGYGSYFNSFTGEQKHKKVVPEYI
jgi:hypothetical protein